MSCLHPRDERGSRRRAHCSGMPRVRCNSLVPPGLSSGIAQVAGRERSERAVAYDTPSSTGVPTHRAAPPAHRGAASTRKQDRPSPGSAAGRGSTSAPCTCRLTFRSPNREGVTPLPEADVPHPATARYQAPSHRDRQPSAPRDRLRDGHAVSPPARRPRRCCRPDRGRRAVVALADCYAGPARRCSGRCCASAAAWNACTSSRLSAMKAMCAPVVTVSCPGSATGEWLATISAPRGRRDLPSAGGFGFARAEMHPERCERSLVERAARVDIGDADVDVIDDGAGHRPVFPPVLVAQNAVAEGSARRRTRVRTVEPPRSPWSGLSSHTVSAVNPVGRASSGCRAAIS